MHNDRTLVELITGRERCRRYTANEKLASADATMSPAMTVSAFVRLHGVSTGHLAAATNPTIDEMPLCHQSKSVGRRLVVLLTRLLP